MFSKIRRTRHSAELESFRQTKHDPYCLKIKSSSNNTFHQYKISRLSNSSVILNMKSLFSLDNLFLLFINAHQTIIKDKQK
jgi:hypothetical protein